MDRGTKTLCAGLWVGALGCASTRFDGRGGSTNLGVHSEGLLRARHKKVKLLRGFDRIGSEPFMLHLFVTERYGGPRPRSRGSAECGVL